MDIRYAAPRTRVYQTTGRNGAGSITVAGLGVGDVILSAHNVTDNSDARAALTSPVAAANTLAQASASDLSAKTLLITVRSP